MIDFNFNEWQRNYPMEERTVYECMLDAFIKGRAVEMECAPKLFFAGAPDIANGEIILESGDGIVIGESAVSVYDAMKKESDDYKKSHPLENSRIYIEFPSFDEMNITEIDIKKIHTISATCSASHD